MTFFIVISTVFLLYTGYMVFNLNKKGFKRESIISGVFAVLAVTLGYAYMQIGLRYSYAKLMLNIFNIEF